MGVCDSIGVETCAAGVCGILCGGVRKGTSVVVHGVSGKGHGFASAGMVRGHGV